MVTVSVGRQINTIELKAISSDPDSETMFEVERFSELPRLISLIPGAICNGKKMFTIMQYTLMVVTLTCSC